jgi:poly(3-hydroxybutyrate) depolymerase
MRRTTLAAFTAAAAMSATLLSGCGGSQTATTAAETTAAGAESTAAETEAEKSVSDTMKQAAKAAADKEAADYKARKAAEETADPLETLIDLDTAPVPEHNYTKANRLPMTGYMTKSFEDGRTMKVYIAKNAPIRPYFTVITVPDGQDTKEFLKNSGWQTVADDRAEGLILLESGEGGWGSADAESTYIAEAIKFYTGNTFFSVFGEHYLVGYGTGAPALEAWAAANPTRVISQVYVNSSGLATSYFNSVADVSYEGKVGQYNDVVFPDGFTRLTNKDIVLPTWYIQSDTAKIADSLNYWKMVNDCEAEGTSDDRLGTVYAQSADSDAWQTEYFGNISEVAVKEEDPEMVSADTTDQIENFLNHYSRYENISPYANQLVLRADTNAPGKIEYKNIEVDGADREYTVYTPSTSEEKYPDGAPMLFVFPGDSQTNRVFMDATSWWKVAEDEGFSLAIICEQYNDRSYAVSHENTWQFYEQLRNELLNNSDYNLDPTRFYATGQSAGSFNSQSMAMVFPEFFAAVASTSGCPNGGDNAAAILEYGNDNTIKLDAIGDPKTFAPANASIPVYLLYGQGDVAMLEGTLWDDIDNNLDGWAAYHMKVNGLELGDGSNYEVSGNHDRYHTWTWDKTFDGTEVPMVKLTENMYRAHNCQHEEMPMLWDYLKHFSYETDAEGKVTARYYSPSAFEKDDRIPIN